MKCLIENECLTDIHGHIQRLTSGGYHLEIWLVDAFTRQPFSGNPAGVVPLANGLTEEDMQKIAREINASETVFITTASNSQADLRLRYFTPTQEVDLCGHATIGSMVALAEQGRLSEDILREGRCKIETQVGVLSVSLYNEDGRYRAEMAQLSPQIKAVDDSLRDELAQALGLSVDKLSTEWPLAMCSTGLWDLFVPVSNLGDMAHMQPNLHQIAQICRALRVASLHVYCSKTIEDKHHFHCRDFSPAVGVPEDPATGTASGVLLGLLVSEGRADIGKTYWLEQGYEIGRPSQIATQSFYEGSVLQICVSGYANITIQGNLSLV
ncbi:phenazine biosynthesis protein PhzF family [Alicyclobacillus tolerans]|uniref:Phenazine biosynthesis protein PhzF family n=1 Tax=Alicyclobacillus tolerans TaxID=90970 RepID=A0A1M6X6A1_9BACL|nr:phenazine biosynthesis protein PhzF family [Alicyclobacillus montanus]